MPRVMRRLLLLFALLACIAPPGASAASHKLWATVNVCDSTAAHNTIGIRGSMPGDGGNARMYMRFEAQWYSQKKGRYVPTGSSSRWIYVGSARYRSAQAGFSFQFDEPPEGTSFLMRGKVDFMWRARRGKRRVVIRRRSRVTKGGMSGVKGGDGRSEAVCIIRR